MELKVTDSSKVDISLDSASYDGITKLGQTALIFRMIGDPSLLVYDFGSILERRKGI